MQVSVEELGGLGRRMTVQLPADEVQQEVHSRLVSLRPKVKLDGFRPGKVPLTVVKRMYGQQVRQEVLTERIQSSFQDALAKEKLRPVGSPRIEIEPLEGAGDFEYSVMFEVFPEFEVAGVDTLKVERPVVEVTEADVDRMLENLRRQRANWNDVEREARLGDRVTVTFEGEIDGEPFPGSKGERVPVELGQGQGFRAFDEALQGVRASDEKEFDVTFPEDYRANHLAGKTAHFSAKVHTVGEPELPEINETFAAAFGIKEGGIVGLRAALRKNMERELSAVVKNRVKQQIMTSLLERNDVQVPQAMIQDEIGRLAEQSGFPADKESADKEGSEGDGEGFEARNALFGQEARRRVKLGLIMSRIVAVNDMKLDNARLNAHLENIASTFDDSAEVIRFYQQNQDLMEGVRGMTLEDQVTDWLLEKAEVIDKPCSFDEVMKPSNASTPGGLVDVASKE